MKKTPIIFIAVAIIVVLFNMIGKVAGASSISVSRYDAEITLTDNGAMVVEETWDVNYPSGYTVAYRDIGFQKYQSSSPLYQSPTNTAALEEDVEVEVFNSNGTKLNPSSYQVGFSYNNDLDERGIPIECEPSRANCESIFIRLPSGMESKMTFKYKYTITGAVTKYTDTSELNWNLVEYFGSGIKNSRVTINIPNVSKENLLVWGHGVSVGTIDVENELVVLNMSKIKSDQLIEFRILMPQNRFNVANINYVDRPMLDEIITYENNLAEETNLRITVANIIFYGSIILVILMGVISYFVYIKYDKEHNAQFTGIYYRELPKEYSPAEMSYLYYFKKINNEDITATLLDLIRRKYLSLDTAKSGINDKNPDFRIVLNKNMPLNDLLAHERQLIEWFINVVGNGSEVTIKQIENYPKDSYQKAMTFENQAKLFVKKAKEAGSRHDFFEPRLGASKGKMSLWLFIPLIYVFICLSTASAYNIDNTIPIVISLAVMIAFLIYISTINKRSINGNEDFVKWKAFRQFLLDFGNLKDYPMPGVVVWEHFLVYATSLKVADKVMDQLEVKLPREEVTGTSSTYLGFGYHYYGFHLGYTLGRINTSMTTARANSTATISAHNAQKVNSGIGGGFSGGRSFGGGGGGFRGR